MTLYKSAANEIAEMMAQNLKEAGAFPIDWEYFKKTVDSAQKCEDLQVPWRWIEGGKIADNKAMGYFLQKEKELKSKFGENCKTR